MSCPSIKKHESTVLVPVGQSAVFDARLAKLNKKAAKFGLGQIRVVAREEKVYLSASRYVGRNGDGLVTALFPWRDSRPLRDGERLVRMLEVDLDYPVIKLGEWVVVGRLESVAGGVLEFNVSSEESDMLAVAKCATHAIACDHCLTKRNRKETYVLRNRKTGEYLSVGKSCLKDFTGVDPAQVLFLAQIVSFVRIHEGGVDEYFGAEKSRHVETIDFLAKASFLIDAFGFVSAAKGREGLEKATYSSALNFASEVDEATLARYFSNRQSYLEKALKVAAYFTDKKPAVLDSFGRNVKLLLADDFLEIDAKHLAIAAAAITVYNRETKAFDGEGKHVGEVGKKLEVEVSVERVLAVPNPYGASMRHMVLMKDAAGNQLKWVSGSVSEDVINSVGKKISISCKVKAHDNYRGVAQTIVTNLNLPMAKARGV